MTIGIIDYGAGNIKSVTNALDRILQNPVGADLSVCPENYFLSDKPQKLETADKIIFPGVGHATSAMQKLQEKCLDKFLQETKKPVLGICLGMQLLYEFSEEGDTQCLGIIPGKIKKFAPEKNLKIPHMGWTQTKKTNTAKTFWQNTSNTSTNSQHLYFVHSYYAPINPYTQEIATHGIQPFTASVKKDNFTGTQYHPEKSGEIGQKVLENFCNS